MKKIIFMTFFCLSFVMYISAEDSLYMKCNSLPDFSLNSSVTLEDSLYVNIFEDKYNIVFSQDIQSLTYSDTTISDIDFFEIQLLHSRYLGYEDSKDFNSYLAKRLDAMSYEYSYEIILSTIIDCKKSMDYAITHKEFKTDIGKISYLCAIISNNLKDTLKTKQKKELIQEGLEKRDEIDYTLLNKEKITIPTKRKDFSIFLDED